MSEFHTDADAADGRHSDIAPELRQLVESMFDRLDPAVRLLATKVKAGGSGKCEQVWCPVCAVVALISGEQHPLLSVVAEHSVALLTLAKSMLDNVDTADTPSPQSPDSAPDDSSEPEASGPPEPGRYQHITVVLDE